MNFLNENNPFVRGFTAAANLILLNWLLVLGCLPVITAGASITAAHTVCMQIIREEESGILSGYLRAFRRNFRQATVLWLLLLAGGALLAADGFLLLNTALLSGVLKIAVLICGTLLLALWMILLVNGFPMLARFEGTTAATAKNALLVGIGALPVSILMILLRLAVVYIAFRWTGSVPAIVISSMFILFSGIIWISDRMILSVYRRMLPDSGA